MEPSYVHIVMQLAQEEAKRSKHLGAVAAASHLVFMQKLMRSVYLFVFSSQKEKHLILGWPHFLVADDLCEFLLADKGYDSDAFRKELTSKNITPVISGRKNRLIKIDYHKELYKERNAVERFFGRIKEYRRIATRYDKTALMYKGGLTLISILMWLML